MDLRQVGKRALESLIRVGALDRLASRIAMLEALDRIVGLSSGYFRASEVGQLSFFGESTGVSENLDIPQTIANVPQRRLLSWEKELFGIYVSDHPLTPHVEDLNKVITHFSAELADATHGQVVRVAGEVAPYRPYQTQSGKAMGFVTLEDLQGQIELVIFSRAWKDISTWLALEAIVVATGKVDRERGEPKILVDSMTADFQRLKPLNGNASRPQVKRRAAEQPDQFHEESLQVESTGKDPEPELRIPASGDSVELPVESSQPASRAHEPESNVLIGEPQPASLHTDVGPDTVDSYEEHVPTPACPARRGGDGSRGTHDHHHAQLNR